MIKLITLLTTLFVSISAFSAVTVIVHPSNADAINNKDIKKIFLGKSKKFPGGNHAVPITSDSLNDEFTKTVLKKSPGQVKAYWSKLIFTGKGQAPKFVDSDADVIELISKNPNMIGYVENSAVTPDVKVIGTF